MLFIAKQGVSHLNKKKPRVLIILMATLLIKTISGRFRIGSNQT